MRVPSRGRITGRETARAVMESAGIYDVEIVPCHGTLTDHYDPNNKRLALSEHNYQGTSLAALGVAAHEAGHAIQHKAGLQTFEPAYATCAGYQLRLATAANLLYRQHLFVRSESPHVPDDWHWHLPSADAISTSHTAG